MEAVVIFEYEAQQDDELDLKVGDVIKDVQNVDEGWCEGVLKGKKGMFPDNFVQVREPVKPPPPVATEANDLGSTPIRGMPQVKKNRRAKVTFSYTADNIDELSLDPGQIVEVLEEEEEGWWRGKVGGKEGVFPSNFVEIVEEDEPVKQAVPAAASQAPPPQQTHRPPSPVEAAPPEPQVHKPMAGLPVMPKFDPSQALAKLKKSTPSNSNVAESKKSAPPPSSVARPPPPSAKTTPPEVPPSSSSKLVEKAKVTFDYEADNEDEISIRVGEIVEIVNKSTDNDGWWEVRLGERIGLIPDNFVEVLPASPPSTRHQSTTKKPPPAAPADKPDKPVPVIPTKPPGPKKKLPAPEPGRKPPKPEPPKPEPHPQPPAKANVLAPNNDKDGQDFGVPSTQPLDSSAVKSRPKKTSRPPSRSNLLHLEEEGGGVLDGGSSSEAPAAATPEKPGPAADKPSAAPWQRELLEKKKKAPLPRPAPKTSLAPKPVAPSKPTVPTSSKPAPRPEPPKAETKPPPPVATTAKEPAPLISKSDTPPVGSGRATPTPAAAAPPPSAPNNEWKEAFDGLQEEFAKFKKFVAAEIATLTDDLDQERKKRAALEVDIERLKKSRGFPH